MNITQLEFFEEATNDKGKRDLKPIDYASPIGMYKELADVRGVNDLSDKCMEALHYLYVNHAHPEDGFIHADKFRKLLGLGDTREVRKIMMEIDMKTELVVYASQNGYKLVGSDIEMKEAIKFALAPAMTSIRRVFAKNKRETLHWLHGFLGNLEKEFGGIAQGQQQYDENMDQREVNHYPAQPFKEYVAPIDERIKEYEQRSKKTDK